MTAATTIPTAMSAAAPMISMVVSSQGRALANPYSTALIVRASDRAVRDARTDARTRTGLSNAG
jgi:hypothetical protein